MENNTILRLNEDERAMLKGECKLGNTFLWIGVLAALLFLIFVILLSGNLLVAVIGAIVLVLLGLLVRRSINRELNEDLANDQKLVVVKPLDRLEMNPLHKSDISSSTAFNYRLTKHHAGYAVFSGKSMYFVDKATFEQLQGQTQFELHYAPSSFTVLGIYPVSIFS